jgi:hypothetical protein
MGMRRVHTRMVACFVVAALLSALAGALPAFANPGGDDVSTAFASVLPLSASGSLDASSTDVRDIYAITLAEGETIEATLTGPVGADFDLFL